VTGTPYFIGIWCELLLPESQKDPGSYRFCLPFWFTKPAACEGMALPTA